ncbi:MAG: DUF1624 domain-containing protein [Candidatus Heimdallarchaeota archaeon]|nr:DUF1624 domain-containing protein [Candidatus Heimdallarchaeota archaeon]
MKRYVSIDFLRGIAIILMLILHIFIETFDTDILVNAVLNREGSVVLLIFAVIIMYLASFAGLFMIISGFGNMISMLIQNDRLSDESFEFAYKKIRYSIVIRGLLIFFIGYFVSVIFWPYAFGSLESLLLHSTMESFLKRFLVDIFWFQIIQSIGLAQVFLGLIYTACLKRNVQLPTIKKILWIIVISIFVLTPIILFGVRSIPGFWPTPHLYAASRSFFENLGFFFLTIIGGKEQAIFPWFAMVFIGALLALDLHRNFVSKYFVRKWLIIGSVMFFLGLILQISFSLLAKLFVGPLQTHFEYGFGGIFDFSGPSTAYMLFIGGGEIIVTILFLWFVEGKNRAKKFAEKTVFIRRPGIIALTIYSLQPITFIPIIFLEKAFELEPLQKQENIWISLLIIAVCMIMWFLVFYLWEKINFIGTFDWMYSSILAKKRRGALNRVKPKEVLYNVEPLGEPHRVDNGSTKKEEKKIELD